MEDVKAQLASGYGRVDPFTRTGTGLATEGFLMNDTFLGFLLAISQ